MIILRRKDSVKFPVRIGGCLRCSFLIFQNRVLGVLLWLGLIMGRLSMAEEPGEQSQRMALEEVKKTILVLSSRGGYGHTAAANTLQQLIGDRYHLKVVHPIDQLRIWGVPSGEQVYNAMLRKGWTRSINFVARHVAPHLFRSRKRKLEKIVDGYISVHDPALIVSLIPYINYPASEAARKQGVPYLLVTTDNDLKNWTDGLEKMRHPDFKVTIGCDLPTTRGLLLKKNIPEEAIETIGLPLRLDFVGIKDPQRLKEKHQIPADKSVILVMMGGTGSKSAYEYARKIGAMDLSTHLIVCTGRNEKLKKSLYKIKLHPSNSMTVLGFTNAISDLMAISDLIITKPGPGTINEALSMQLPLLIDNIEASLFWERANVDMVTRYGVGAKIRNYSQMEQMLCDYLYDETLREEIRHAFTAIPENQFHIKIKEIIDEMIERVSEVESEWVYTQEDSKAGFWQRES